jgi:hypothetical protein
VLLVQSLFIALPAALGIQQAAKLSPARTVVSMLAVIAVVVLAVWTGGWGQSALVKWSQGAWRPKPMWPPRMLLAAVLSWPLVFMLTRATAQLRRQRV